MNGNGWLNLLYKGIIVETIVTVGVVGGMVYLWCTGKPVPPEMLQVGMFCLGLWGGSTGATVAYANGSRAASAAGRQPDSPTPPSEV